MFFFLRLLGAISALWMTVMGLLWPVISAGGNPEKVASVGGFAGWMLINVGAMALLGVVAGFFYWRDERSLQRRRVEAELLAVLAHLTPADREWLTERGWRP